MSHPGRTKAERRVLDSIADLQAARRGIVRVRHAGFARPRHDLGVVAGPDCFGHTEQLQRRKEHLRAGLLREPREPLRELDHVIVTFLMVPSGRLIRNSFVVVSKSHGSAPPTAAGSVRPPAAPATS